MPDQQHAANIIPMYKKYAAQWDAMRRQHFYEQAWLDRFLSLIPPQSHILDLGCGAALPIAPYLIGQNHRMTGIDSSPAMLDLAGSRFPEQSWILADMRELDLKQTFNAILAWDSFFHLTHTDQEAMVQIFARHACTGTALMFTSGPRHGVALGEMQGEILYHASLDPEEYELLLNQQGFKVVDRKTEDPDCTGHTVWLAQMA